MASKRRLPSWFWNSTSRRPDSAAGAAPPAGEPTAPRRRFTVRLHFLEPDAARQPGQRVFDVALQGQPVLAGLDVVAAAGGPLRPLVRSFDGISAENELEITLSPGTNPPPILSGVEIIEQGYAPQTLAVIRKITESEGTAEFGLLLRNRFDRQFRAKPFVGDLPYVGFIRRTSTPLAPTPVTAGVGSIEDVARSTSLRILSALEIVDRKRIAWRLAQAGCLCHQKATLPMPVTAADQLEATEVLVDRACLADPDDALDNDLVLDTSLFEEEDEEDEEEEKDDAVELVPVPSEADELEELRRGRWRGKSDKSPQTPLETYLREINERRCCPPRTNRNWRVESPRATRRPETAWCGPICVWW